MSVMNNAGYGQLGNTSSPHIRSIGMDMIWTILTCGLFNIYLQYKQMIAVNAMLRFEKYRFLPWFALTIVTCGLYHIYHEYRKTGDICHALGDTRSNEPLISVILSVFGLMMVADAIQQAHINRYFNSSKL